MRLLKFLLVCLLCGAGFVLKANPTADFSMSAKQGCLPLTIQYTDRSSNAVSYLWDFGNGNQSTLQNPSAIYYQSGKFTVTLTVKDANGNTSVKVFSPIRVFSNPTASFKADTVACVGQKLAFTDLSIQADTSIVQWTWDFGDGSLGSKSTTSHAYTYSAQFSVGLTIVDGFGCKSLINKSNYIRIKPSPKASFKLDNTYSCRLPGVFNATNTSTGADSYQWYSSSGASGSNKDFSVNIGSYGDYSLRLIAVGKGCNDTFNFSPLKVEKLIARFGFDQGGVCVGTPYQLSNTSSPQVKDLKYHWDFGDGTTDNSASPKHNFLAPGKYTVKLVISNGVCSDSISQTVTVNPKPDVSISVVDSVGCEAPFKAKFKITGTDYAASFWTFGDLTTGNVYVPRGMPIEHTYQINGDYEVKARIVNSFGCAEELTLDAKVHVGGQWVEIEPESFNGCIPIAQLFTYRSLLYQPLLSTEWIFTDSSKTYNSKKVNKLFSDPGNFYAIVKLKTIYGCELTDSVKISVGRKYLPSFKITERDICGKDTIHFINTSPDSIKSLVKFRLKVLDSMSVNGNGDSLKHMLKDSFIKTGRGGIHQIKITASHYGCITDSEETDTVIAHGPYMNLKVSPANCQGTLVKLDPAHSWANKALLTKVNIYTKSLEVLPHDKGPFVTSYEPSAFKFKGWNDTFNCVDSADIKYNFPVYDPRLYVNLDQTCAPAKGSFIHNQVMLEAKWLFPNGDTSLLIKPQYTFKSPGLYTVKLAGYYDSSKCMDTLKLIVKVDGVQLKGRVISAGKCLPVQLTLVDSSAAIDTDNHSWQIGNDKVKATSLFTYYNAESLPMNDSVLRVKHIVQNSKGCVSEKEYILPFSGPIGRYTVQRFSICDTPVFYFKSYVDSSRSALPIQYKWKMSSGLEANSQFVNAKFSTIGMNYFSLSMTDRNGCQAVFKDSFEVSPNMLQPLFKADPRGKFCPPLQCQFTDQSKTFSSEIVKWEWDFGDGTTSQLRNPQKLYLLPGSYDVTLTITSRSGCTATIKKPGYVIVEGPRGYFDFDRGNACLPHTVEFRGTTLDSAAMEWDLGDGVVRQGNYFKHTYTRRGRYIPAMILSDTRGCKYTLPPIDTIYIYDYPKAQALVDGLCLKQPIQLSNQSVSNHEDATLKSTWYLNDQETKPGADSVFKAQSRGFQKIRLIVENKGSCKDTFDSVLKIYAPEALFEIGADHVCLGQQMPFVNKSRSDTTIQHYDWNFGDGNTGSVETPSHQYSKPGEYDIRLIATDILNCKDTLFKPLAAVVGDTVAPLHVPIRRASVLTDRAVELVFAKYPDFDFNTYIVYREYNNKYYKTAEIKNRADTFFTDPQCVTTSRSYCYKIQTRNLCLLNSDLNLSKPHCTIETKAKGLEEANRITWSPYIGFDSIAVYQIWRQAYKSPLGYELIDSVPATTLQYTDSLITCNTRQNYRIQAIQYGGFKEFSKSDTASAQPYYFNQTKPNYAWRTTVENNDFLRLEWRNNAYSKWGIKGYLIDKSFSTGEPIYRNRYYDAADTVLEDRQVKVNERSYVYTVRGLDNCLDTTPYSNQAQSILLSCFFDQQTQKPGLQWNHYQKWDQEIDYYEIEKKLPDGSFILIGKVAADVNRFIDLEAAGSCQPDYTYRVRAVSKWNTQFKDQTFSLSNEAQAFPASTLFMPSAFSPDGNEINEIFGPKGQYISKYHIQIFNRWGEKVFDSHTCMQAWDGRFEGELCMEGVYLYHVEALGADGKHYNLKATFTLLR